MYQGRGRPRNRVPLLMAVAAASCMLVGYGGPEAAAGPAPGTEMAAPVAEASSATPSPDDVRTLKEGKTLPVAVTPNEVLDIPASSAEVTLTDVKQAHRISQGEYLSPATADPGTTYICLEFKVKNTSNQTFKTTYLADARWTGKDGETENVDQAIGVDCAELGLEKKSFLDAPEPRPGEFVRATTVLMVPDDQPGVLEFDEALEHAMFKVETSPTT
ncbi:hypothetical protein ACIOEW_08005 [Streptomyces sp. NPDC087901]|uniref:hypothetical protein n=1 Tax=Streptomyces sp. NPDC087901 TaxID=3365818 RepID=UPI003822E65F